MVAAPDDDSPAYGDWLKSLKHVETEMMHPKLCSLKDKEVSILLLVVTFEIFNQRAPDLELAHDQIELLVRRFQNQMGDLGRNTEEPLYVKRFYLLEMVAESRFMTFSLDGSMDGNQTCKELIQVFSKALW